MRRTSKSTLRRPTTYMYKCSFFDRLLVILNCNYMYMYMYNVHVYIYTHMYSDMLYMLYSVHVHCISLACCTVYIHVTCMYMYMYCTCAYITTTCTCAYMSLYMYIYTHMYSVYKLCMLYNVHRSTHSLHAHIQWCSLARAGTGRGELEAGWAGSLPGPYRRSLMMETVECSLSHVRLEGGLCVHACVYTVEPL